MKKFVGPYDESLAENYDQLWGQSDKYGPENTYLIDLIGSFIKDDTKWIDAGCGTAFILNHFKQIHRTGFDLSETMLEIARRNNPGIEFYLHDISKPKTKWNNKWNLVTCTGQPWMYLHGIKQIEDVALNLYNWTSLDHGICMLAPDDVQAIGNIKMNYNFSMQDEGKKGDLQIRLNALIWSFYKPEYGSHQYLICPFLDQWIRWFSLYFEEINVEYKKFESHDIPRTYIICSKKKPKPNKVEPDIYFGGTSLKELEDRMGKGNLNNENLFLGSS